MLEQNHSPLNVQSRVLNRKLSIELYSHLMFGRMINRTHFIEGRLASNPLFEELLNNFDQYRTIYDP